MTFNHFEDLWNWSEKVIADDPNPPTEEESLKILSILVHDFKKDQDLGFILLHITNLARLREINAFVALKQAVQDFQSEVLEESD